MRSGLSRVASLDDLRQQYHYSAEPQNAPLRRLIADKAPAVSAVSYVEVLGYHRLTETERRYFEAFFAEARILPLSQPVLDAAVRLRQTKKIKLGDSLIAATALLYDLTPATSLVSIACKL